MGFGLGGLEVDEAGVAGGGFVDGGEELEGGRAALKALLDADGDELEGGVALVGGVSPGVAGVGVVVCLAIGGGETGLEALDFLFLQAEEGVGVGEGWIHVVIGLCRFFAHEGHEGTRMGEMVSVAG